MKQSPFQKANARANFRVGRISYLINNLKQLELELARDGIPDAPLAKSLERELRERSRRALNLMRVRYPPKLKKTGAIDSPI